MRKYLLAILPLISFAQPAGYWQQQVDYKMNIKFDVNKHQFEGDQKLVYTNNSPDTITEVFYHLYFNAFQPGSMMDVRSRNIKDPDKRIGSRIEGLKEDEIGYHKIDRLTQDGMEVGYNIIETVLKAELREPLYPGQSTTLEMTFNSQVPVQIRRSGRNNSVGIDYTMAQWYPKLAAYDKDGWHPDPYIAREFYADYGKFDVTIDIESQYIIAGTGILQNEEAYWEVDQVEEAYSEMKYQAGKKGRRTWNFKAENVHDFAWAADPDYKRYRNYGPDSLELNYYFLPKYKKTWQGVPTKTIGLFGLMNDRFGKYAYPQFSIIQGGDGGMEYPMCTMVIGTGEGKGFFDHLVVHETIHSWYYGMLGSNEHQYPWMDEGFSTYAEDEILNLLKEEPLVNAHLDSYGAYLYMVENDLMEPLSTPADYFSLNKSYSISSYQRGALFLSQLRYIIGEEDFDRGMKKFYSQWLFRHPAPLDLIRVMEKESGLQLDWFYNFWVNTTKTIDYKITDVAYADHQHTSIKLEKIGEMPMPLEVVVLYKDGGRQTFFIPLASMMGTKNSNMVTSVEPWPWTHPTYELLITRPIGDIKAVMIDPYRFMCDVDVSNNEFVVETSEE